MQIAAALVYVLAIGLAAELLGAALLVRAWRRVRARERRADERMRVGWTILVEALRVRRGVGDVRALLAQLRARL